MLIRVVQNCPPEHYQCSDITQYVGNIYEVGKGDFFYNGGLIVPTVNGVWVDELNLELYEGKYEIVEE